MYCVGLTGGLASGKSVVADLFARCGARVIDADEVGRRLSDEESLLVKIREKLGAWAVDENGKFNRREVRRRVFADAVLRQKLEAIMHPPICADMVRRLQEMDFAKTNSAKTVDNNAALHLPNENPLPKNESANSHLRNKNENSLPSPDSPAAQNPPSPPDSSTISDSHFPPDSPTVTDSLSPPDSSTVSDSLSPPDSSVISDSHPPPLAGGGKIRPANFGGWKESDSEPNANSPLDNAPPRQRREMKDANYVIAVVPLLFESRLFLPHCRRIAVVDCALETQIKRAIARDGGDKKQAAAMIQTQWTRQQRRRAADDIIANDGDYGTLKETVEKLHRRYLALSQADCR